VVVVIGVTVASEAPIAADGTAAEGMALGVIAARKAAVQVHAKAEQESIAGLGATLNYSRN
jgi:hypothetical protein